MKQEKATNMKVIEALNSARSMEILSIHQYMIEHYMFSDLGYNDWATEIKKISIVEMKHAELFAERVRELNGEPTSFMPNEIVKSDDIFKNYQHNIELENGSLDKYNKFAATCVECGDHISAKLFEDILKVEQEHHEFFKTICDKIKKYGDTYLAVQK